MVSSEPASNLRELAVVSARPSAEPSEKAALPEIDLREVLRVLWRRRYLISGTVIVSAVLAVVALSLMTPQYTATAQVMVDPRQQNVVDLEQVLSGLPMNAETMQSEIEVLTSRNLASRVIGQTKLQEKPEFNPALTKGSGIRSWFSNSEPEELTLAQQQASHNRVVDRFEDALSVRSAGRSRVINISFTSADPALAAQMANTVAELYLVEQLEAKFDATRRASTWLNERLEQLRIEAEAAELAAARFKSQNGNGVAQDNSRMRDLNADVVEARMELAEARAGLQSIEALRGNGSASSELPTAELKEGQQALADLKAEQAKMAAELGPRHPRMVSIANRIATAQAAFNSKLERSVAGQQSRVREAEQKLVNLQADLSRLSSPVKDANESAVRLRTLEREAAASRALYETFLNRFKETTEQQGLAQADARLISRADVPVSPSAPNKKLVMLLVLLASAGLGLVLAFMAEQLDSGFRSADQIENKLGLPAIGMIPSLKSLGVKDKRPETYVVEKPTSALAEAMRMLRTSILLANVDQPPKLLLVTSALPAEGKTTVALTLARQAALSGEKVLIIDADLRRPRVHGALEVANEQGLVELVSGQATLEQVIKTDGEGVGSFAYITAGKATPHSTEIVRSQQMKRMLRSLAGSYSLVIVDSPPVLPVADAKVLATLADKVLYVVRWSDTRREVVQQAVKQLRDVGANFAGIVLNHVDVRKHAEYSYSDSGYYYGRYRNYYVD